MPIQFTCPYCGAQTNVADRYAGQSGPCAGCGRTITIPGGPAGAVAYPAASPQQSTSSGWTVVFILLGVGGMFLVCGGILVALLLPAVGSAREAARRAQCKNNMRQIAFALLKYEDEYGQFPPAYVADKEGRPMHSWRVLILPYLDRDDLYLRYRFDEPWDSANNRDVARRMGHSGVFHCPSNPNSDPTRTDYVMVVGPGCISDGPTGCRIKGITDDRSNVILLVEVANSKIGWTEPRDLDAATISYQVNDPTGRECISSYHPGLAMVAFADGRVEMLDDDTDPDAVRQMTQISDGQPER